MKRKSYLCLCCCALLLQTSCFPLVDPVPVSAYQPILMSRAQLEKSVVLKEARIISNPGKLYHYGAYILINELFEGVHVINNQNPEAPVNIGFIQVPGNVDFAVKENVLYVDNAVDLVAIDFSDLNGLQITKRVRNTFPALMPPDNLSFDENWAGAPEDAVIVGWELIAAE